MIQSLLPGSQQKVSNHLTMDTLLDFSDPRFKADPYPVYRRLRERAPIWRSPWGDWVLTRHADIVEVLRNPEFGHDYEEKLSSPHCRPPSSTSPPTGPWR